MKLSSIKDKLSDSLDVHFGRVENITATHIEITGLSPSIGDIIKIVSHHDKERVELSMVTKLNKHSFIVSPFRYVEGLKIGDSAYIDEEGLSISLSDDILGRVVDPFMNVKDGGSPLRKKRKMPIIRAPIDAMKRGMITKPFSVGVKTIDGLLTCGEGQKLGIFAGSGVGKSTLMGMIVRGADAPIKIVALIGERGREIPEFIEKNLGGDLTNTVLIVATSDDSPLMRKYGAFSAMAVAEYFKEQGRNVVFMMDSVTRFAMAQREIGLALGEPPTSKGYPPSSLTLLAQLMERAGKEEGKGSITAFFTVLIEGDDMSDPIADQSRSILDGHIVLSRELTDYGIYPPINILNSASRVMGDVATKEHVQAAIEFKKMYALLKENEVLIRIGAYQKGNDEELDRAIEKKSAMDDFLKQDSNTNYTFSNTINELMAIITP